MNDDLLLMIAFVEALFVHTLLWMIYLSLNIFLYIHVSLFANGVVYL